MAFCNTRAVGLGYLHAMRWSFILFAVYILGLALVPCSDAHAHGDEEVLHAHAHDDHEGHETGCSPLCVCQCCHLHVVIERPVLNLPMCAVRPGAETRFVQGRSEPHPWPTVHPPNA